MAKKSTTKKKAGATPAARSRSTALSQRIDDTDQRIRNVMGLLSKAFQRITALEANSHPQRVEVEPWDPKEGDLVVTLKYAANGSGQIGAVMPIQQVDDGPFRYRVHPEEADDINRWYSLEWLRPATSEEITLYKQEEEARLKKEKEEAKVVAPWTPVKFKHGLGVEVEGRIVCDGPDHYDYFFIMTNGALGHQVHKRKRHEFTIIEP